jgi:hypothetical protein
VEEVVVVAVEVVVVVVACGALLGLPSRPRTGVGSTARASTPTIRRPSAAGVEGCAGDEEGR